MKITQLINELKEQRDMRGEIDVTGFDEVAGEDVSLVSVEYNDDTTPAVLLTFGSSGEGE